MNITVLCPHYAPDLAPTGEVMTCIAEELAARGHRLHVVTALPWYQEHAVEEGWTGRPVRSERTSWGCITRVHPFPTDKSNVPARALAFGGFTVLSAVMGAMTRQRPDVVLAMSPPLTLGLAGWFVARSRRAPFVFNIQDVFPDVAIEAGVLKGSRVIAASQALETFTYRRSDAVTVLSEDLKENLDGKLGPDDSDLVHVIPNFIDTGRIEPGPRHNRYRKEFGLGERRVVMYAGNLGFSQPVGLLLEAARRFADREDVLFVVNGGGAARPALEEQAADLSNVRFVGLQPKAIGWVRCSPPPTSTSCCSALAWPAAACPRSSTRSWPPVVRWSRVSTRVQRWPGWPRKPVPGWRFPPRTPKHWSMV